MALTAQLSGALDCSALATQFLGSIAGPAANLNAVTVPVDAARMEGAVAGAGVDLSPIAAAVAQVAGQVLPLLASVPAAGDVLGTLETAVSAIETVAAQDFGASLDGLLQALRRETAGPPEGGHLALVLRIVDVLAARPEAGLLQSLIKPLIDRAQLGAAAQFPLLDIVRGADGALRLLGALMCLATVLGEAERLAGTMAALLDSATFDDALAGAGGFAGARRGHAGRLRRRGRPHGGARGGCRDQRRGRGGAAAGWRARQRGRRLRPGRGDAGLPGRGGAAGRGRPRARHRPHGRPRPDGARAGAGGRADRPTVVPDEPGARCRRRAWDAVFDRVEAEIAGIAADIDSLDPAIFVAPLAQGIQTLAAPVAELENVVSQVTLTLRQALGQVRDGVAALPVQAVADTLRAVFDPIAAVLNAIADLLAEIEAALDAAAGAATGALTEIDAALADFKAELDGFFAGALQVVQAVDIDAAVGAVAQNIEAFAQVLQQAQMKPYFDTAVDAIGAATGVVEAVPFDLLPESMKADVDAAVLPIKQTDVLAVEREIETALGIGEDGRFSLRGDVEAAVAGLQAQYLLLLQAVQERHPRTLLAEVDRELDTLAERVRAIAPELTLQPLQDAVDQLKQLVGAIDLDTLLEPLRGAFAEIDATLERYSPGQLVAPLQQRLDQARGQLVSTLKLDDWAPTLDELQAQALALLDRADPAQVQPLIERAVGEAMELLARFPGLSTSNGFGTLVASLLSGTGLRVQASSFPEVRGWLGGGAAGVALAARTDRFAAALAAAHAATASRDVQALASPLLPRLTELRDAAQALALGLGAGGEQRARLDLLLPRLDGAARIGTLVANRARFLALLERALGLVEGLRRTGFSEADAGVAQLRLGLAPLEPAGRRLRDLLAALGLDPENLSVVGVSQAVLAAVPPARLAGLLTPLFQALRSRVQALLQAVLAPVQAGVADLRALLDAIDLGPLAEEADAVVDEVRQQIATLHPDQLLQEPLAAFDALREQVVEQDPMAQVTAILTALRDLVAAVLDKLSLEQLLETPLAIFDEILAKLLQLDPNGLLTPVLDQLDQIAAQVDSGLDDTVAAFQQLQAALPGGGGGSSVSGSVSVG
jgi:hypothetical protein